MRVENTILSDPRLLIEELFPELGRRLRSSKLLGQVMVFDLPLGLLGDVLEGQLVDVGVLEKIVLVVDEDHRLAVELHQVFMIREVAGDLWPLFLDEVLDLGVTGVQMEEFKGRGFLSLLLEELLYEEDLLVLSDELLPIGLEHVCLISNDLFHLLDGVSEVLRQLLLNVSRVLLDPQKFLLDGV